MVQSLSVVLLGRLPIMIRETTCYYVLDGVLAREYVSRSQWSSVARHYGHGDAAPNDIVDNQYGRERLWVILWRACTIEIRRHR